MARILVTGASGFVGAHVARRLAAEGHDVRATGRDAGRLQALGNAMDTQVADLAHDDLRALLVDRDVVVHCAALSAPWGRPEDFHRANVEATTRLLAIARAGGLRRFIHLGSPSIYFRFRDQLDLGETFSPPHRWITAYAQSKWLSEERVREAAANGLPALVLRPRAVYGEGDRAILPRLLAVASRGWFPLVNQGRALIDVTHIDNLVGLIAQCIDADVPGDGRAYNVSDGAPVRVRDLLEMLFQALERDVRLVPLPRAPMLALAGLAEWRARLTPGCPEPRLSRYGLGVIGYSQTLDIGRARRELHYQPQGDLRAGLERYARWWRTHDLA
ncbi:radical SAM protein [Stenotrophomonas panacihumi]|uniref:Radical SAM protein n=1 Tax=Stenotrophomonas panacihumi TaxID=676599 RepID=A0A0R0AKY8_9GAMM|nr:NAD(P)-dependent oxidoreductase [Stenotrophomonas panacihumi]KRG45820.1 radical SAM protein [Stenotrophomonas panacihumi]PTN53372.1 NAD(P)-dependent oxidoreductase [Stenotrophomonas panacihumi]